MEFLKKQYNMNVEFEHLVDKTLIAIQGPKAYKIMEDIFENDISKLKFMNMTYIKKDNEEY